MTRSRRAALAILAALASGTGEAADLAMPQGANRAAEALEPLGTYAVPIAPWSGGLPTEASEGRILSEVWQVPGAPATAELMSALREQILAQGYTALFECETAGCGGFDFRFETMVLPEPEMHVNLADFRFFAARRQGEGRPEFVTLLVSRTRDTGYVQVIRVTAPVAGEAPPPGAADPAAPPQGLEPPRLPLPALPDAAENGGDGAVSGYEIGALLESAGRAVLEGVAFETGSSRLSNGEEVPALEALAEYLKANPSRRVMLVGHTDASGRLEANIAISRSRARAVLEYLTGTLDVPAGQLSSDGVGYLMPLAPNLTEEGRARNRRVEAVLISTE